MKILIIGAAGMVGAKLAQSLAADPAPGLEELILVDVVAPARAVGCRRCRSRPPPST